jgi:O-antigen/teichoic acid export membrane protein
MTGIASRIFAHRQRAIEAAWTFSGQALSAGGSLVLVRVLTNSMEPTDYGRLSLALTAAALVAQVPMAVVPSITRHYSIAAERGDIAGYWSASIRILARCSGFAVALGTLVSCGLICAGHADIALLSAASFSYGVLRGWVDAAAGNRTAARDRRAVALCMGLEPLIRATMVYACFRLTNPTSIWVLLSYSAAILVVGIPLFRRATRDFKRSDTVPAIAPDDWRSGISGFARPFVLWGTFTWLQTGADRWALEYFCDSASVGRYAAAYQLGFAPLMILSSAMAQFIAPIVYQRAGNATSQARLAAAARVTRLVASSTLATTLILTSVAMLLHRQVFSALIGPNFQSASGLLPWIVAAAGMFSCAQFLCLQLMAELRTREILVVKIGIAILGILASLCGASLAKEHGVAYGLTATSFAYLVWTIFLAKRGSIADAIPD